MWYFVWYSHLEENKIRHSFGFFLPHNVIGLHQHCFRRGKRSYYVGPVWVWGHKWPSVVSRFSWRSKFFPTATAGSGIWQWSAGKAHYLPLHFTLLWSYHLCCSLYGTPRIKNALCCANEQFFQFYHCYHFSFCTLSCSVVMLFMWYVLNVTHSLLASVKAFIVCIMNSLFLL